MTLFLSTFLGVLVLFGYRILLFQVFDQFLVGILECLEYSVFNCKYTLEKIVEQFRFYFVILCSSPFSSIMHGIFSLDFVFDCINFQNILLSSFIFVAIERSYSYVACLTW